VTARKENNKEKTRCRPSFLGRKVKGEGRKKEEKEEGVGGVE